MGIEIERSDEVSLESEMTKRQLLRRELVHLIVKHVAPKSTGSRNEIVESVKALESLILGHGPELPSGLAKTTSFKVGDVVQLKSGGLAMTVSGVSDDSAFISVWWLNAEGKIDSFVSAKAILFQHADVNAERKRMLDFITCLDNESRANWINELMTEPASTS